MPQQTPTGEHIYSNGPTKLFSNLESSHSFGTGAQLAHQNQPPLGCPQDFRNRLPGGVQASRR